jgi:tRNA(fMet)-specific endonuclease VapC
VKKVLIDTNAYTSLCGGDERALDALAGAETVYASVIVLGELYAGFKGGRREKENLERLRAFLAKETVRVLLADPETAEIFGEIKHRLKEAGTPIPINDVWIAAHAMQTGSFVVSYDKHFALVPGLLVWGGSRDGRAR